MNRVFVDTSAILALMVPADRFHGQAARAFERVRQDKAMLVTTSYVLAETYALVGRRMGVRAVRALRESFEPALEIVWVGRDLHDAGLDLLVARDERDLSVVDAVSLALLGRTPVEAVFAFDRHFDAGGFRMLAG